jgi:hypothetical protein
MRDLSLLERPLVVQPEPGLDTLDPRLLTIIELAERQSFREAADRATELLTENIFDIRPISILLYQAFLEGGPAALDQAILIFKALVTDQKAAVGPVKQREKQVNLRIKWFFENVGENFRYHATKKSAEWQSWRTTPPEAVKRLLKDGEDLVAALDHPVYRDALRSVEATITRCRGYLADTRPPAAPAPAPAPAAGAAVPPAPAAPAPAEPESLDPVVRHVELVVSHRFLELNAKLRAFEDLVARGKHEKAAVVSDDINAMLDRFDPREYFPELFAPYSALVSEHIDTLVNHWSNKDSPGWNALAQFYRVDLTRFVGK